MNFNKASLDRSFPWIFPLFLLGVCLIAYFIQGGQLGFYWDDWEDVFIQHLGGGNWFWQYFSYDRPFTAWVYTVFFPLFGKDPVHWQLLNIALRWLGLLGIWWSLQAIWRGHQRVTSWIVLLLAVFPAFSQQAVAVTYSRHFASYALFALSLAVMLWGLRHRRWFIPATIVSLAFSLAQMFTIEYFMGLEFLRPLFLWFAFRPEPPESGNKGRIKQTLLHWAIYILPIAAFLIWRFFFFAQASPDPEANAPTLLSRILQQPLPESIKLLQYFLQDLAHLMIFSWLIPLQPEAIQLTAKATQFSWLVGLVIAGLLVTYWVVLRREDEKTAEAQNLRFPIREALLLGILAIILGGLPVWVTDRQIVVGQWSDRFSLGPMLGACILLVSLIEWLGYKTLQKTCLLGLCFAMALASQIQTTNKYRLNWDLQKDYYWQLAWRVPGMTPGTSILGNKIPFGLASDYSVAYTANIIYAPHLQDKSVPFWFLSALRYRGTIIPDFKDDQSIKYQLRMVTFEGNTSNSIVVYYRSGPSCLRVLNQDDAYAPLLSADELSLLPIAHLSPIIPKPQQAATPPMEIFGQEPPHGWCYFYQKAELERQQKNWEKVATLADEVESQGLKAQVGVEWAPFIEGLAHTNRWAEAKALTSRALDQTENMSNYLCNLWKRIDQDATPSAEKQETIATIRKQLDCK